MRAAQSDSVTDDPFSDDAFSDDDREVPTVSCERCGREWELDREVDDLDPGSHAIEQFALDHERHTGHYPDGVTPWVARCDRCPDGERFLAERPARRWARTHARHTRHPVRIEAPRGDDEIVSPGDGEDGS
ncbi:hypothetical protein C462_15884 [Halorubrum distributum JCM 13916]|uniref:Uncharacterized protein n=1 Tax=Halorubrum distributum JCM 13916 TaxID=1230455 RepID=M0PB80_9EURY|nr:hypothetical protein C462_15884 [Halorubrum arcis JCM 13916]